MADAFAGSAAHLSAEPLPVAALARRNSSLCFCILLRIAFVEKAVADTKLLEHQWQVLLACDALSSVQSAKVASDLITKSGHDLVKMPNGRYRCEGCHRTKTVRQFHFWFSVPCGDASFSQGARSSTAVSVANFSLGKSVFSLPKAAKSLVPWGTHLLQVLSTGKVQCVLCRAQGNLADVGSMCTDPPVHIGSDKFPQREIATITDGFAGFRIIQKAENEKNLKNTRLSRAKMAYAFRGVAAGLRCGTDETHSLPGPPPKWLARVDSSHQSMFYGAGLAYCADCGCLSSSGQSGTHLFKPNSCKRVLGLPVPSGSKGRLQRLREGQHPIGKSEWWPDGRAASIRVQFVPWRRSCKAPAASLAQDQPQDQQEFQYIPEPRKIWPVVPPDLQLLIDESMNEAITLFQQSEVVRLDFLQNLELPRLMAEKAIMNFYDSSAWDHWLDTLGPESFQFELEVASAIESLPEFTQNEVASFRKGSAAIENLPEFTHDEVVSFRQVSDRLMAPGGPAELPVGEG